MTRYERLAYSFCLLGLVLLVMAMFEYTPTIWDALFFMIGGLGLTAFGVFTGRIKTEGE